jgi:hypothetical protein
MRRTEKDALLRRLRGETVPTEPNPYKRMVRQQRIGNGAPPQKASAK